MALLTAWLSKRTAERAIELLDRIKIIPEKATRDLNDILAGRPLGWVSVLLHPTSEGQERKDALKAHRRATG